MGAKLMPAVNTVSLGTKAKAIEFVDDNVDINADSIVITKKDNGGYIGAATFPDPPEEGD